VAIPGRGGQGIVRFNGDCDIRHFPLLSRSHPHDAT
jgi:hypothetical protein